MITTEGHGSTSAASILICQYVCTSSMCSTAKRASVRCSRAIMGPSQGSTATQLQGRWTSPTCLLPRLSTGLSSCGAPRYERDLGCILKVQQNLRIILFGWEKKTNICGWKEFSSLCVFCVSTGFHIIQLLFIFNCNSIFIEYGDRSPDYKNNHNNKPCVAKITNLFPLI